MNVEYLGRSVSSKGFRAFIYHKDGQQKLVNSWDEFIRLVDNNEWFASKEVIALMQAEKAKKLEEKEIEEQQEIAISDEQPIKKEIYPKGRKGK